MLRLAILGVNFPSVTVLLPDAPPRWQAFFEGAFAHEEEERAETVVEFRRRLRECLESDSSN